MQSAMTNDNWYETFFEGLAVEFWLSAVTPEMTLDEVHFLMRNLQLPPGGSVLDVPCGNGRHSAEFARRGYRPTGVDISPAFLDEARMRTPAAQWILGDMRILPWHAQFDGAFCWGNSFGYFDHLGCQEFLQAVSGALKPGARFVLETGSAAESVLPAWRPERTLQIEDIEFSGAHKYDAVAGRLDITYTFARSGRKEVKKACQWIHTVAEIQRMTERAGFTVEAAVQDTLGNAFQPGSPRLIFVSRKIEPGEFGGPLPNGR